VKRLKSNLATLSMDSVSNQRQVFAISFARQTKHMIAATFGKHSDAPSGDESSATSDTFRVERLNPQ